MSTDQQVNHYTYEALLWFLAFKTTVLLHWSTFCQVQLQAADAWTPLASAQSLEGDTQQPQHMPLVMHGYHSVCVCARVWSLHILHLGLWPHEVTKATSNMTLGSPQRDTHRRIYNRLPAGCSRTQMFQYIHYMTSSIINSCLFLMKVFVFEKLHILMCRPHWPICLVRTSWACCLGN